MSHEFSLLGGPLHRLGQRLGLVRGETNTVWLGIAIGGGVWIVILILAFLQDRTGILFSMSVIAGHMRLLVVIPLFFIAESWAVPRMTAFVQTMAASGMVAPASMPAFAAQVAWVRRITHSWWPDVLCFLVALGMVLSGSQIKAVGGTGAYDESRTAIGAWVYFRLGLFIFQFLLWRWILRYVLWGIFLWRFSRLELQLRPGHPDGAGGIDSLGEVHERFTPLVVAISVLQCAGVAESVSAGAVITQFYPSLAVLLVINAVIFLGPLFVFTDKLWAARTEGLAAYTALATRFVTAFEKKWLEGHGPNPDDHLADTGDFQSLADLGTGVDVVRRMNWVPFGPRLMVMMALSAVVPLAPLLLFQYPLAELVRRLLAVIVGQ